MVKKIMKIATIITAVAGLFGCGLKPQVLDGPGMEYVDSDYRTVYANVLAFDDLESQPCFAVAYLGSGEDGKECRDQVVENTFQTLSKEEILAVEHIDFGGEDYFLVIPRYRTAVEITHTKTQEKQTVYLGEAFTVSCDGSGTEPEVELHTEHKGVQIVSLQLEENGKLKASDNLWDVTEELSSKKK